MIFRSKAPLRISFGGGGTDVSPYCEEKGGAVLSTTIDKFAYCTLIRRNDNIINVESLDYDTIARYPINKSLTYDGKLDLVKATINVLKLDMGLDLFMHSDVPPGSGLGASSTTTVALVGVCNHCFKLALTEYEIAELSFHIEREELGIKGGKQDQYASTFGGFNYIEFQQDRVLVNPLRIKPEVINELEYRLLLCFTGKTRLSSGIIDDQVSRYILKEGDTENALDTSKALAIDMKNALLLGKINEFGLLLNEAWYAKKKFSRAITDPYIDEMIEIARKNGALGGKLLGAGGGGYLLFLCEFDKWHIVAEKLENFGGKVTSFAFDSPGLQTWEVNVV